MVGDGRNLKFRTTSLPQHGKNLFRKGRASPEGELINVIVKEAATSDQPNSEGAVDADVPAEEDQAKEGAWELFTEIN